jgi:hypothetical protein
MMPRMPPEQPAASSQCLGFPSFDPRPAGRRVALYALLPAIIWLVAMSSFAFFGPGLTSDFRAHIGFGLAMFCAIILVPLALVAQTLNWVVRRVAGAIMVLSYFGMLRGALTQGFGIGIDACIAVVLALLFGSILFILSRPPLLLATGDAYDFLNPRDVFSKYTFMRKAPG